MSGTFIETRPWTDEDFSEPGPLGTTAHGITLNEPLRGWAAFSATFRVMFVEEARKSVEFAKKRQMVLFPLLLTLVTAISTIGLQFLVGDSTAQTSDIDSKTFTWQELRFALHLPMFMFSLGMGTFAFMGRDAILRRTGTKNFLLAAPALQPLPNSMAHFVYFVKEVLFYMLSFSHRSSPAWPSVFCWTVFGIRTPCSGVPSLDWLAMSTTLGQGLALSFLASSLWLRGRPTPLSAPCRCRPRYRRWTWLLTRRRSAWGLAHISQSGVAILLGLALSLGLGLFASLLILDDFDVSVVERVICCSDVCPLGFLGRGHIR